MVLSDQIFGFFLDWTMRSKVIARERPPALKDAHGNVLELGFGTGLNLPYFPATVERLTVVDPEDLMPERVARRIAASWGIGAEIDAVPIPSGVDALLDGRTRDVQLRSSRAPEMKSEVALTIGPMELETRPRPAERSLAIIFDRINRIAGQ